MSDLRTALADALGPLYRVEREVRPVGEYRLFVATLENADPASLASQPLLIKVLPAALSLGINDLHFERAYEYICNNPVAAGMCATAGDWPWTGRV